MNIKRRDLFLILISLIKNVSVETVVILSFQKKNMMITLNSVKLIKQ